MASLNERRENGDGSYSINVALTDADGILQVERMLKFKRITGSMQGASITAGATLSQDLDLREFEKAVLACVFATAFTGTVSITNLTGAGNLWVAAGTVSPAAATSAQTPPTFLVLGEKQKISLTNTGASAVTITTAEVIAQ